MAVQSFRRRHAAAVVLASITSAARGGDLMRDDFTGTSLNSSIWGIGTWSLDRTQLGFTPAVTGGIAQLRLDTYNPNNPGGSFKGTEIWTNAQYAVGTAGLEMEARVQVNPLPDGLVTSFFTYAARTNFNPPLADEIDFEDLSKQDNAAAAGSKPILLTTWNDYRTDGSNFGDPNVHNSVPVIASGVNLAQYNTYRIRWLGNRVEWYVNDVLVRTATQAVATDPMNVRLNFWAPASEWSDAYSAALQPTSSAAANKTYLYNVDWVAIRNAYSPVSQSGPNRVFTDHFKNGTVSNSDGLANFWTPRVSGGTVTETTGDPLKLAVTGAGFPQAEVASAVRSDLNFFQSPLRITADGIDFTTTPGSAGKSIFRMTLSPETLGAGTDSEYTVEDALSLRIQADGSVAFGFKLDAPNANSEFSDLLVNATMSGPVRRFILTLSPTTYTLSVEHELSATDGTRVSNVYAGSMSLPLSSWRQGTAVPATGNSAIFLQSQFNNSGASESMTAMVDSMAVDAVKSAWASDASATWSTAAAWSSDGVPNFSGANAILGNAINSPRTVTLDAPVKVGVLQFNAASRYTLAGSSLTLSTPAPTATIQVLAGSHTIQSPVVLATDTAVLLPVAGTTLTLAGISGPSSMTVTGPGKLEAASVQITNLSVSNTTLKILLNGTPTGTSVLSSLTVSNGGALDLTNNDLVVRAMTEPAVSTLFATGALRSTAAGGPGRDAYATLAVAANTNGSGGPLFPAFDGIPVATSDVLVMYTYKGDTDLNGFVDANDLANLLAGMNGRLRGWTNGDVNYDGIVDGNDLSNLLASLSHQGASFGASGGSSGSVPDPHAPFLLTAFLPLARRRHRETAARP